MDQLANTLLTYFCQFLEKLAEALAVIVAQSPRLMRRREALDADTAFGRSGVH